MFVSVFILNMKLTGKFMSSTSGFSIFKPSFGLTILPAANFFQLLKENLILLFVLASLSKSLSSMDTSLIGKSAKRLVVLLWHIWTFYYVDDSHY